MLDQLHAHVFESGPFAGLPRGHYRVALVDPPWTFRAWSHRGEGKSASQHYRCQSLEEISALPVDQLMAPDAALFLSVTQPMLPEALRVIAAWGFEYRTVGFIWIKMPATWSEGLFPLRIRPRLGLGYHTRSGEEQYWLALRGKGYQRQSMGVEQVLFAAVREHSRKPYEINARIDRLVRDVPRIELFARCWRSGWATGVIRSTYLTGARSD